MSGWPFTHVQPDKTGPWTDSIRRTFRLKSPSPTGEKSKIYSGVLLAAQVTAAPMSLSYDCHLLFDSRWSRSRVLTSISSHILFQRRLSLAGTHPYCNQPNRHFAWGFYSCKKTKDCPEPSMRGHHFIKASRPPTVVTFTLWRCLQGRAIAKPGQQLRVDRDD